MSWATAVTVARIALIPVFVYLMYEGVVEGEDPAARIAPGIALVVFALAAMTDSLDGYLARRHQRITPLGQFLDPLADKLLVGAALVVLVTLRGFPLWAAIVIVAREVAVSVLRILALRKGRSLPASGLGKIKTGLQIPTVMIWLFPRMGWIAGAQNVALALTVIMTLVSGVAYAMKARDLVGSAVTDK